MAAAKSPDPPAHRPFVPDEQHIPEFTLSAVLVGSLLGIVFGASSLYLVLKVGLTVSASIPVAVLSITLFRGFSKVFGIRKATILENNIVQTAGSAGESIAFGVGVTMPALMILGFEMDIGRVMVVSVLGGLLGILMMIPLRRAFIVKQHGTLKYPEGTACADVLIVGEQGGSTAKTVFIGFGLAFVYQFMMQGLKLWKETPSRALQLVQGSRRVGRSEPGPARRGLHHRHADFLHHGGRRSAGVVRADPGDPPVRRPTHQADLPATSPIRGMEPKRFGTNTSSTSARGPSPPAASLASLQALPLIVGSIKAAMRDMRGGREGGGSGQRRTDRDLPLWLVGVGSLLLVAACGRPPRCIATSLGFRSSK